MAIQDLASNPVQAGTTGQMLGFVEPPVPSEVLPLRMYRFIVESIRIEDERRGALFLKRFLDGPQFIWADTQARIFAIKDLWDLTKIEDEFLPFLKNIVGWTSDLSDITDALDSVQLRKLIGTSIPLWRERGPEDTIIDVIQLVTAAKARIWNWFDFRWVLDETEISEEHEGRDPWIIDLPGPPASDEYRSNLRVVDDGTLDHELVVNLVKLMRASGERIDISFITFLDLFSIVGDDILFDQSETGTILPIIEDGVAKLDGVGEQKAVVDDEVRADSPDWKDYVTYWRVRGKGTATGSGGEFGGMFYWTDESNYTRAVITPFDNRVRLIQVTGGTPSTLANIDFTPFGRLYDDTFYGIRVEVVNGGRLVVFVDSIEIINITTPGTPTKGRLGLYAGADTDDVEFDEIEMFQVPLSTELVDINS